MSSILSLSHFLFSPFASLPDHDDDVVCKARDVERQRVVRAQEIEQEGEYCSCLPLVSSSMRYSNRDRGGMSEEGEVKEGCEVM